MKKYIASYNTDKGVYPWKPFEYDTKAEAIKAIREIGIGETFIGGYVDVFVSRIYGDDFYETPPKCVYEKRIWVK